MHDEVETFQIVSDNGDLINCDILLSIPAINEDGRYIVFTDYMLDENKNSILQYGKIIEVNNEHIIQSIEDDNIIKYIKKEMERELLRMVEEV